jgi:hypothetical protein
MFERVADAELAGLPARSRRRAAAAVQVLYSAMAWEYLTDYWDLATEEAIATVQTAISALFAGLRSGAAAGAEPPPAPAARPPRATRARRRGTPTR